MKNLCLLGATGSIGLSVCDLISKHRDRFALKAVSCYHRRDRLEEILKVFKEVEYVCVCDEDISELESKYPCIKFLSKKEGLNSLIELSSPDMVVNALVGFVGLSPTIYALKHDIDVALANKETLVAGGELVLNLLKEHPSTHLYPIDSEHVALAKCLKGKNKDDVARLVLTASGGSFRDLSRDELKGVSLQQALNHPSWKMGAKITIDSATMVNKGFEIIEAYYLFGFAEDKIDVLLHDESVIHSLIEMKDNSYVADLGPADMRIPISFALFEENYASNETLPHLRLEDIASLHFRKLDSKRYPALELARRAIREGGTMGCALNAANEACNLAFREGKLEFYKIEEIIEKTMNAHRVIDNPSEEDLIYVNKICYEYAMNLIKEEA